VPWSCEALVRLARGAVPSELVGAAAWPPQGTFARAWPVRIASIGGIECRLGARDPGAVDFAFCIAAGDVRLFRDARPPAGDGEDASAGVWPFLARWADPASPLHNHVPLVWLEFDHGPLLAGRAVPFVTFMVSDALAVGPGRNGDGRVVVGELLRGGLEALTGRIEPDRLEGLLRCLTALPDEGRLRHVAAMPHRGTDAVRLIVSLRRSNVADYLRRLASEASRDALDATLAGLDPGDGMVSVNLDVEDCVGPKVGVEFYWPTSPLEDERWSPLLDGLVAAGRCTPIQRAALSAWPTREADGPPVRVGELVRQLLVKVVFWSGRMREAKAYLAFKPRLRLFQSQAHRLRPTAPGS